jgi:UDP-glucose 4-epimerase
MMLVTITGAGGFLGYHLTSYLKKAGFSVTPVSRRSLSGMIQVKNYTQTPGDQILLHLAEEPDRGKVNDLGESYLESSAHVVEILSKRFQRVIYMSSNVVYGDENDNLCAVDMPVFETDLYSKLKIRNERRVIDSGGCVVRLANLFGVGMSTNNVLSDIIAQIPGEGPLRVRDDTPIRDFLSVSNTVSALSQIVKRDIAGVVNVGSGIATSINTLAKLMLVNASQKNREIIATKPSSRSSKIVLDISETVKAIDWVPSPSLKDQLKKYLEARRLINDKT